jgi:hypothetical protein
MPAKTGAPHSGDVAAGPGPLKIESADSTIDIAYFTADEKPRSDSGFQSIQIEFAKGNSACSHFRETKAPIPVYRQFHFCDSIDETLTIFPIKSVTRR